MLGGKKKRGLYIKPNDSSELGYLKRLLKSTARMILTDFEVGKKRFYLKDINNNFYLFIYLFFVLDGV